jgi:hypothetical protein
MLEVPPKHIPSPAQAQPREYSFGVRFRNIWNAETLVEIPKQDEEILR